MFSRKLIACLAVVAVPALAATPQDFLKQFEAEARQANAAFAGFSGARGEKFFRTERTKTDGERMACATCHTQDPRGSGRTRANKPIEPLAPAANPTRFTDAAKVDKWFRRNCDDVLGRTCSAEEKGDFLAWLLTVK